MLLTTLFDLYYICSFSALFILIIITHSSSISLFSRKIINLYGHFVDISLFIFIQTYIFVWLSYFTYVMLFYYYYYDKNILFDSLGLWLLMQLLFIFIPITRNSFFIYLFKISHSSMIFTHKIISYIFCISIIIKFVIVIVINGDDFIIKLTNKDNGSISGILSFITNIFILIFSNSHVRNRWYEIFLYSHKIFITMLVTVTCTHIKTVIYYLIPSLSLYLIDIVIRFTRIKKSKYSSITFLEHQNAKKYAILTVIINKNIKIINSYYMICIKSISSSEWHPFSLLEQQHNKLTFCAKILDDESWTGKINNKQQDIFLQGPYLYFQNIKFEKYKKIICISSGTGIIPILHTLKEIDKEKQNNKLELNILFIWIIKDYCLFNYLSSYILNLNHSYIKTRVYITGEYKTTSYSFLKYKKPNIELIFSNLNLQKKKYCSPSNTVILTIGQPKLINDVVKHANIYNVELFAERY